MDHRGDGLGRRLRHAALSLLAALLAGGAVTAAVLGLHRDAASTASSASPPARLAAAMADDPARHDVVLFGGAGSSRILGDTWLWNGSSWSEASPAHSPPALYGAQMAWDPKSRRDILMGGIGGPHCAVPAAGATGATRTCTWSDQAWAWDGADWTRLSLGPVAGHSLAGAEMATDPAHGDIVLLTSAGPPPSGGVSARRAEATATLAAAACPLMPANPPPGWTPPACPPIPCYALGALPNGCFTPPAVPGQPTPPAQPTPPVEPASLTWTFDGSAFRAVSTDPAAGGGPPLGGHLAWFSSIGRLADLAWEPLPMMGTGLQPEIACMQGRPCPGFPATVWEWDGAGWAVETLAQGATRLPAVEVVGADAARGDVVAVDSSGATWVATDPVAGWTRVAAPSGPGARSGEAIAADPASGNVVLFGGTTVGTPGPGGAANDTWTWDGRHWSQRGGTAPSPPSRGTATSSPSSVSGRPAPAGTPTG